VVVFGVVTSTLLTLMVLPVLYLRFGGAAPIPNTEADA
jgi:Cu/Ag efflux pump CusA